MTKQETPPPKPGRRERKAPRYSQRIAISPDAPRLDEVLCDWARRMEETHGEVKFRVVRMPRQKK